MLCVFTITICSRHRTPKPGVAFRRLLTLRLSPFRYISKRRAGQLEDKVSRNDVNSSNKVGS